MADPARLRRELTDLLNAHGADSRSGTPDFVLAEYLLNCLKSFDMAVIRRDSWQGQPAADPPAEQSAQTARFRHRG